jgi:methionyl-tRNA formyltransferase
VNYIFIGGTYRGWKTLEVLMNSGHIPKQCVILKEDDHEILRYSERIAALAESRKVPFEIKEKLADGDYQLMNNANHDLAVVCGWRTIIDPSCASSFRLGLVAAHDSLLPKYRGFAPLNWAIINGETETGVTLFLIGEGEVDSGAVISQLKVPISRNDYAIDVYEKITDATITLFEDLFTSYQKGAVPISAQDENQATYTCKRSPQDGAIDWRHPWSRVYDLIRALAHPYPGAFCASSGKTYHIRKASPGHYLQRDYVGRIPGKVIDIRPTGIEVLCGNGSLFIEEWENKEASIVECPSHSIKSINTTLSGGARRHEQI